MRIIPFPRYQRKYVPLTTNIIYFVRRNSRPSNNRHNIWRAVNATIFRVFSAQNSHQDVDPSHTRLAQQLNQYTSNKMSSTGMTVNST